MVDNNNWVHTRGYLEHFGQCLNRYEHMHIYGKRNSLSKKVLYVKFKQIVNELLVFKLG